MNDMDERLKALQEENTVLKNEAKALRRELKEKQQRIHRINGEIRRLLNVCIELSRIRTIQAAHLVSRFAQQFCKGTLQEKKAFIGWFFRHFDKQAADDNHQYNPLFRIIYPLQSLYEITEEEDLRFSEENKTSTQILAEPYQQYDVLVFSVIDYDFRYQRPQQIADHYARRGHRVFYINANFAAQGGKRVKRCGQLYQVTLEGRLCASVYALNEQPAQESIQAQLEELLYEYGVRDALMIADYPTWVTALAHLKKRYGFALITDYMDDFTGFAATCEPYIKENCIELLKMSDAVVASSQYLVDVARQHNERVTAIRNGTEFEHFHSAYEEAKGQNPRKTIGYYGAIAEWFDAGKVEYLAKAFPECDIVLIGQVTNERIKTCRLKNVKRLGEIPYADLPGHLRGFDVCLIPFDTSTDLIKATNPVKFYEYLSAGKKIVATEIPELEPYRDRYVYLARDNAQFAACVKRCLDGTDVLAPAQACMDFARENDWTHRLTAFEGAASTVFPMVSIVVLCYNQIDYTRQCVKSILENTAYPNYELILVDNCSTDGTADYLRDIQTADKRIRLVLNQTNRGFAGGNNDGIAASQGEYIVLLNNDTLVTRGWLTGMVKRFRQSAKVGMVGAVTNSIGNEAQIAVRYQEIMDMPSFAYAYTARHMGQNYAHDGVLAMFCVMISRVLVEEIGPLDEHYGIGMFEDDDYSVAAERAGYELILPEDVFIHHFGSVSFKKLSDETYRRTFEANKAYFEKKWKIRWKPHHYRTFQ